MNSISLASLSVPVTPALIATLIKHYPRLRVEASSGTTALVLDELSAQERDNIHLDMLFYSQNPSLPLENLCSHLGNYTPRNESQRMLLDYAERLINYDDMSRGAGLYIHGSAGIGKSHIAMGISKQFMRRRLNPHFQTAEQYSFVTVLTLEPGQVWVIDDMNSGFHISSRLFKQVVINAHDKGGRVFVTSNKPYEQLMDEIFVGDSEANKVRYMDRTKGMFKILEVSGESYRQATAWYV